ncbi:MAG: DUF2703 domain-containing protein [Anaerolineae bacterium]|nr:DUF2703 domain-containing protein [Anaerolineae bacterium]
MHVEFLYYADCPSHKTALERLQTVLAEVGSAAAVEVHELSTEAEAHSATFVGSPTIRINGQDIVRRSQTLPLA